MTGDTLKEARIDRHLGIKDVEQATSIRAIYIEAIENGEYDKLPGEVYAKGFIKNYANFLKLDGDALVREFINEIAPQPIDVEGNADDKKKVPEVKTAPFANGGHLKITEIESPKIKVAGRRAESSSSSSSSGGNFIIAATVMIAAIAGGAWYLLTSEGFTAKTAEVEQVTREVAVEQPAEKKPEKVDAPVAVKAPVSGTAQATTPAATAENTVPANDVNVQAVFTDQCWTRVTVDGAIVYEGMVNAGQTLNWQGKNSVKVRVGNAGGVSFTKNGQNMGVAGNRGAVVEKTFNK